MRSYILIVFIWGICHSNGFGQADSLQPSLSDSSIYSYFQVGMSRNQIRELNGKSAKFFYRKVKRRLIKKPAKSVPNYGGCGTTAYFKRKHKVVNRKGRLHEVWYYPAYGGVYVKFNEENRVQTLRFIGQGIGLSNGLAIGISKDSVAALIPNYESFCLYQVSPSVDFNRNNLVSQIILHDGSINAKGYRNNAFPNFEWTNE